MCRCFGCGDVGGEWGVGWGLGPGSGRVGGYCIYVSCESGFSL